MADGLKSLRRHYPDQVLAVGGAGARPNRRANHPLSPVGPELPRGLIILLPSGPFLQILPPSDAGTRCVRQNMSLLRVRFCNSSPARRPRTPCVRADSIRMLGETWSSRPFPRGSARETNLQPTGWHTACPLGDVTTETCDGRCELEKTVLVDRRPGVDRRARRPRGRSDGVIAGSGAKPTAHRTPELTLNFKLDRRLGESGSAVPAAKSPSSLLLLTPPNVGRRHFFCGLRRAA